MILRFMANIEHSISQEQLSSLADRLPGWSGSDIKVCPLGYDGEKRRSDQCSSSVALVDNREARNTARF